MVSEAQTRQGMIDTQLARAGWAVSSRGVLTEFMLHPASRLAQDPPAYGKPPAPEFADYALLDRFGRPLAIVEAKNTSRDPMSASVRRPIMPTLSRLSTVSISSSPRKSSAKPSSSP